jgi:hypothetical protein
MASPARLRDGASPAADTRVLEWLAALWSHEGARVWPLQAALTHAERSAHHAYARTFDPQAFRDRRAYGRELDMRDRRHLRVQGRHEFGRKVRVVREKGAHAIALVEAEAAVVVRADVNRAAEVRGVCWLSP